MKCDVCKKIFEYGNWQNGIPNGIALKTQTGKTIVVCAECVMKVGMMTEKERDKFFGQLQK